MVLLVIITSQKLFSPTPQYLFCDVIITKSTIAYIYRGHTVYPTCTCLDRWFRPDITRTLVVWSNVDAYIFPRNLLAHIDSHRVHARSATASRAPATLPGELGVDIMVWLHVLWKFLFLTPFSRVGAEPCMYMNRTTQYMVIVCAPLANVQAWEGRYKAKMSVFVP